MKGAVLWSSDDLNGLGMGIAVDGASGEVYVAGFASSEGGADTVVVHKVRAAAALASMPCRREPLLSAEGHTLRCVEVCFLAF